MAIFEEISEKLQIGKAADVQALCQQALDMGFPAKEILENGLLAGMSVVGDKFKQNLVFVPQVLIAARAMNMGVAVLKPHLVSGDIQEKGTAVIGTVKGDMHDIGKNLVKMMMEGRGITVVDLGTDVSAERFVAEAKAHNAKVICCSALLTTTMGEMAAVVKEAEAQGIRAQVKIMVGGAPVTLDYANQIGADAYTSDAASAAEQAEAFCLA